MSHIKYLKVWADELQSTEYGLINATRLASGRLGWLIVLQEPCDSADFLPYDIMLNGGSYGGEDFDGCYTLREVEGIIADVSHGQYDLDDVAILDINTLLSADAQSELEDDTHGLERAHSTFQRMVLALQPDVILTLQCAGRGASNKFVQMLSSSMKRAGTLDVVDLRGKDAILVRGFHPSTYLREDYTKTISDEQVVLYQEMAIYCFRVAYEALRGRRYLEHTRLRRWRSCFRYSDSPSESTARRITRKLHDLRDLEEVLGGISDLNL